ncbi:MAG: four helix bundle protein [Bacteroidetes bacterium]|nr:four helix bundle protein [Bacteroidota bacterium]
MLHTDLEVWKRSIELVTSVYKLTEQIPSDERFGLTGQIRRAAVSVPSNIAEGAGRLHRKELVQFLNISTGSLSELETLLIIARNLGFINQNEIPADEINSIRKMLVGLTKKIQNQNQF